MTNDQEHRKRIKRLGLTYFPPNTSAYSDTVLKYYDSLKKEAMRIWNRHPYSEAGKDYNRRAHEVLNQSDRSRRMIEKYDTRQSYLRSRVHELAIDLRNCEEEEVDQVISDMEDLFSDLHEVRESISQLRRNL